MYKVSFLWKGPVEAAVEKLTALGIVSFNITRTAEKPNGRVVGAVRSEAQNGAQSRIDSQHSARLRVEGYSRSSNGARPTWQTDAGKICLRVLDDHYVATPADFARALHQQGYSTSSCGSILSALIHEGMLKRTGRGRYRRPTEMEGIKAGEV